MASASAMMLNLGACAGGASLAPTDAIRAALIETGGSGFVTITSSTGQEIVSPALGINSSTSVDLSNPTVIVEAGPDMEHVRYRVGALLAPSQGTDPSTVLELWITPDRMVVDSRSFDDVLAAAAPGTDLGALDASLSYIDLTSLGADGSDMAQILGGSSPPDLTALATRLPEVLTEVTQVSEHPNRFRGITDYASLLEALGGDLDTTVRAGSALLAENLDIDAEALANSYLSFFRATTVEVMVELDDLGAARSLSTRAELSGLYRFLFDDANAPALGLSAADAQAARQAMQDAIWRVETKTVFQADEQLVIPPPPPTDLNRTAAWRDFLVRSGLIQG